MFEPDDSVIAGFLDRVVAKEEIEQTIEAVLAVLKALHAPSHAIAKQRLRGSARAAMRQAIDAELTLDAYTSRSGARSAVVLPGANRQRPPLSP
jgi:enoyl-CoA hydratase